MRNDSIREKRLDVGLLCLVLFAFVVTQTTSAWAAEDNPANVSRDLKDLPELLRDAAVDRELAGGESHSYRVNLEAGQYLRIAASQSGINLTVALFGSDGVSITEVDNTGGTEGSETVSVVSETPALFRLDIRARDQDAVPGRYVLKIEEVREATAADRTRVAAEQAYAEGQRLRRLGKTDPLRQAVEQFTKALSLWRSLGDHQGEVLAQST
jgi:hypothetical protein